MRLFAPPGQSLLSFVLVLSILVPVLAIGLGFDSVNGEYNRRTMSRILAQPIYRDALLFGKFLASLVTIAISLLTLWLLVIGFGRFGQIVARVLRVKGLPFTALDSSQTAVDFVRRFGNKVYYGDASRLDLLRAAGAATARVLVLAVDVSRSVDDDEARAVVATAAAERGDKTLIVGAGRESTRLTVRFIDSIAEHADRVDYVSVLPPHYFKGAMTGEALRDQTAALERRG